MDRRSRRPLWVILLLVGSVVLVPGEAWAHGHHYVGILSAIGDQGGTVSATADNCASAPSSPMYHDPSTSAKRGCVDIHSVTGFTSASAAWGTVILNGSGLWPNTTFDVTWLNSTNDPGDLDDDWSNPSDEGIGNGYGNDYNNPYCHFWGTKLGQVRTDTNGSFGPVTVGLGTANVPDLIPGQSELCIMSTTSQYFQGDPPGDNTSQANSVPICIVPMDGTCSAPPNSRPFSYVAFGDSLTTGFSIPDCRDIPEQSRYGCVGAPTTTPYPELVAARVGGAGELARVRIWGYEASEAKQDYENYQRGLPQRGGWEPQYAAVRSATTLVTGVLGINDLSKERVTWLNRLTVVAA